MATHRQGSAWGAVLFGLVALPAGAVTLGQVDTFQDLAAAAWVSGPANPVQPAVVASGGPAGAGDAYLLIGASGGQGPGSRLVGINAAQWTGDYRAAGVSAITMDVANFGPSALHLRLHFYGGAGSAAVTEGVALPAGSGWTRVRFELDPAGPGPFLDLRLFHGSADSAVYPGPGVVAQLGVDNVRAVPEPASGAAMALGLLLLAASRRRLSPQHRPQRVSA